VILLAITSLRGEWCDAKGEKFDLVGSAIYGFVLISTICGFSFLPSYAGAALLAAGLLGLLFFVRYESSAPSPVLEMRLFRATGSSPSRTLRR